MTLRYMRISLLTIFGILSALLPLHELSACTLDYNCDNNKNPGSCERARAEYDSCVQNERAAQEEARRQALQKTDEYKAFEKFNEMQKAVSSGTNAPSNAGQEQSDSN